jgi:hypothetical protein
LLLASCGGAGLGDTCDVSGDCGARLQCVSNVCRPLCERAPDCGDGYACNNDGICVEATGDQGDLCSSEVECKPGLACRLSPPTNPTLPVAGSCGDENSGSGHPAGAECMVDSECRNNTCELGRCIDLCNTTRDCGVGMECTHIPWVPQKDATNRNGQMFAGCLQSTGTLVWNLPVTGPLQSVPLAIPESAQSVSIAMRVDDPNQYVGVTQIIGPGPDNVPLLAFSDYYGSKVRHRPALGQSVLAMPSTPDFAFSPGMYTLSVRSLKSFDENDIGTAIPVVTAVVKLDSSVILDLHFFFLNLDEHPCASAFDNGTLNAANAVSGQTFKNQFVHSLSGYLASSGVALGTVTYEDLKNHPDLDGPALANRNDLLKLGTYSTGINVFFVRSMSPAGVQAFGPNPGPAGLASTAAVGIQSGVIISLDSLCYESWSEVARLTTHELARYMGLYNNVELDGHADPIADSDSLPTNLMYFSEAGGGTTLSTDQVKILGRSPVLR